MPDNKLHEGEFIVKMLFLCLKLKTNGLKIEKIIIAHCHLV